MMEATDTGRNVTANRDTKQTKMNEKLNTVACPYTAARHQLHSLLACYIP